MSVLCFANIMGARSAAAQNTRWKEKFLIDRLTGEKTLTMTNAALRPSRQFGRDVTATVIVECGLYPYETTSVAAAIIFSEQLAFACDGIRYRFDDSVVAHSFGVINRGAGFRIASADDQFSQLRSSSKLLVEAGNMLFQFNTTGADIAIDRIPCGATPGRTPGVEPKTHTK